MLLVEWSWLNLATPTSENALVRLAVIAKCISSSGNTKTSIVMLLCGCRYWRIVNLPWMDLIGVSGLNCWHILWHCGTALYTDCWEECNRLLCQSSVVFFMCELWIVFNLVFRKHSLVACKYFLYPFRLLEPTVFMASNKDENCK